MVEPEITDIGSDEYSKALAGAMIYEKTATIHARLAQPGEIIQTTLANGTIETTNTAHEGDFIVTNPDREQYIIRRDKFSKNYEPTAQEGVFKAIDLIRAIKNPTGDAIRIIAPWGEEMSGDKDCYITAGYDPDRPDEIGDNRYIIGAQEFADTYVPYARV